MVAASNFPFLTDAQFALLLANGLQSRAQAQADFAPAGGQAVLAGYRRRLAAE
ncbi:hypothetical protein J2W28_005050 [Variovorax boronicumulans]|nr:hypothetical protein [Variovorax boronicumulans]MDQ0005881.1 hypothetical protein [Variovorax boronicumulans]MDQ0044504.1 hypothetical protein [Variovorax boronicumulans]